MATAINEARGKEREGTAGEYLLRKLNFKPTGKEQAGVVASRKRSIVVSGGAQSGKSYISAVTLVKRYGEEIGKRGEEGLLYWLVARDYERTRGEFDHLARFFAKLGLLRGQTKRVDPGEIELEDGTRIETKSGKDPRVLAMKAPDGILGCEASQLDLETYHRLRERVAPTRGWIVMSGTLEGSIGWYPSLVTAWEGGYGETASFIIPTWTNVHLFPGGRNDPEILRLERETGDEFFTERISGRPVPPRGLVFHEFRPDLHVRDVEWEPGEPVHIWTDPGYRGTCAVEAVQIINGQVRVFDEVYEQGLVTEEIIRVCQGRAWWGSEGKCNVKFGVIDLYGYQHQAMPAPVEIWLKETGLRLTAQKVGEADGRERLKAFLKPDPISGVPKIVIDSRCRGILSELGGCASPFDGQTRVYRWKVDREGNILGDEPKDENNHGIKAVIYGLVDQFGYARRPGGEFLTMGRW